MNVDARARIDNILRESLEKDRTELNDSTIEFLGPLHLNKSNKTMTSFNHSMYSKQGHQNIKSLPGLNRPFADRINLSRHGSQ